MKPNAGGTLVHEPGHVIDLMPTLLDVCGAEYPTNVEGRSILPMEGRSLKGLLIGEPANGDSPRPLFWEHQGNKAVRLGDWKAVASGRSMWELYNLSDGRTEIRNVAADHPEKTRELAALWQAWAERCGVWEWDDLQRHRRNGSRSKEEQSP